MAEFESDGTVHLSVTDAEMNEDLNEITVELDGKTTLIPLPREPHRGKPATITVVL
jgi:hypothetical protein